MSEKTMADSVPFEQKIEDNRTAGPSGGGSLIKRLLKRWFIDGMGAMALGLFSSLIIGLIISQLAAIPGLGILGEFSAVLSASSPVVGAAIGVAIAYGLKVKPLAMFASAATGAFGYSLGGPVGAYVAALVGAEIGNLVAGKTPVDIIVTPIVTIIAGCAVGYVVGAPLNEFMSWLGNVINDATLLSPVPMGIAVAILVGMALTAPISSAALCIMMGIDGLAAGAAVAGCCAQMMGFAAMSFKENGWGGFLAQGLGTSMLQVPNIIRRPHIWIPPILASAVVGPISTVGFGMLNTPTGAGMGTSGLVGQFGAWAAMSGTTPAGMLVFEIILVHVVLPIVLTLLFAAIFRRIGWIRPGDLKLQMIK
ncbi:PTS sugar transporter subunit IIC [Christensenellaceae bacterium OttesenSCG-928-K19]|nr:PTS sugar transporter subunit IIC [Christensenellaceae bacterium OttesenSCG-928-K19]